MRQSTLAISTLLLLVMTGCGASRPIKYYALDPPSQAAAHASPQSWPVSLLIGHFTAPHLYREDRMVYRTGASELHAYEQHRWAEPPTEIVENLLLRDLRDSGRFRAVQSRRGNAKGDFILRGRLDNFEELMGPAPGTRIRMAVELYEVKSGATVWSQSYAADESVSGKGVDAVVESFNHNLQQALARFAQGLAEYFAAHPPR